MNRKQQGDIGVASAIWHYTKAGYVVSLPTTDNARYDLVVDIGGRLKRVQCKSTRTLSPYGVPIVQLRTMGGNKSWSGEVRRISVDECDLVYVHVIDGDNYEFPVEIAAGRHSFSLGSKYTSYKLPTVG